MIQNQIWNTNEAERGIYNPGFGTAVTSQPAWGGQPGTWASNERTWMPAPTAHVLNCPPGLERLTIMDKLVVHDLHKVTDISSIPPELKFEIKNSEQQSCYFAFEGTYY